MEDSPQIHYYYQYYPANVKRVLASGSSAFTDDTTVLKYPLAPGKDTIRLETEGKLLNIIGPHERIIRLKRNLRRRSLPRTRTQRNHRPTH